MKHSMIRDPPRMSFTKGETTLDTLIYLDSRRGAAPTAPQQLGG